MLYLYNGLYLAVKNEMLACAATEMDLENTEAKENNSATKGHIVSLCLYKMFRQAKFIERESRLEVS